MTTYLFEQPWIIGAIGTCLSIVTLYGWTQSGNSIALKVGAGFGVVTILLLAINLWVVTDSERLRVWLADTASELQNNRWEQVQKRVSPQPSVRVANISDRIKNVKFSIAQVTKIHGMDFDYSGDMPTAFIRMNAFVEAESGGLSGKAPRWVGLTLEKRGQDWLILDLEDRDPQHEFVNSDSGANSLGQMLQNGR